ncbi:MAG: hypothetical protein H7122_16665 [Chitinophagaceae bacterium]|nr:hypothetical protein [Chitinophagaceae bacterium]
MPEKNHLSEDYISLSGFGKGMRQILRTFFWFLSYLSFVFVKSRYIILIGLVTGLLLGYLYFISRPIYYRVSMIVEYSELSKKTYAEMLDQLNKLAGSGSNKLLANQLQVSEDVARNISFIESRNINDDPLESDTSTRRWQPFKIIVGLRDNTISDTLQGAFVSYLNNSPLLKKVKQEQRKIWSEKLSFITSELQKLDSLKLEYNRFLARPNAATFYNNAFNPAEIYVQSNALANQREIAMRWLMIDNTAVSMIDGFKAANSPQSISLFKSLLILGGVGFLIAYLIGFMRETKKKVSGA